MGEDTILVTLVSKDDDVENEEEHIIVFKEEKELALFLLHYDKDKYSIIEIQKILGKLSTSPKSFFIKPDEGFEHGQNLKEGDKC